MLKELDCVISVRDRDNPRIKNCIDFLKGVNKIFIVDYGSQIPVDIKGSNIEIIKVSRDKYPIWNKSHALNIGIRKSTSNFIATVDCDIILSKDFLSHASNLILPSTFLYTNLVRRIKQYIPNKNIHDYSYEWSKDSQWAVGGIQIFPRWWIEKYRGYDESLIYWGGIDNYAKRLADFTELSTINIKKYIYHQEHIKQKEEHLTDPEERQKAKHDREHRDVYINHAIEDSKFYNKEDWGTFII